MDLTNYKKELCSLVKKAGEEIMKVYQTDIKFETKNDDTPVTIADKIANDILCTGLKKLFPQIPIVSEENANSHKFQNLDLFFLVDPLDGTKEFINKRDQFTVNIGLIKNKKPIAGIVYVPVTKELYFAPNETETFKNDKPISVRKTPNDGATVMTSYSHSNKNDLDKFLKEMKVKEIIPAGSSLKICRIAEGKADLYPRLGPTMEWDTSAAHAVLQGAGGTLTNADGTEFLYGKKTYLNPFFIAKAKLNNN
ncbi:MAG: 3'(2'),5'-bisphosphate nucleotidase CysQ [Alphaproteobacteria bacterium]